MWHRSCNDAIFSLNGLSELTKKTGNKLHACFIDLSKAYDSVDRPLAWELFGSMGFPSKMLQLIKDLHNNITCAMQAVFDRFGWCNVAKVSNIASHRRLRWLGHLVRMPDERLPKRVLSGHVNGSGLRGKSQKQWVDYIREDLHIAGLSYTWWRNPKTGQADGMP